MSIRVGTYNSLIQGVSQQVPQERADGQLGEQINMLSDPNSGLRRRSGAKYERTIEGVPKDSFVEIVEFLGEPYVVSICTNTGRFLAHSLLGDTKYETLEHAEYFKAESKHSIKYTMARDTLFLVNTDKVPKQEFTGSNLYSNPARHGYFSIMSSSFSRDYSITISNPILSGGTITVSTRTSDNNANQATPEWVATSLYDKLVALNLGTAMTFTRYQNTVSCTALTGVTNVSSPSTSTYVLASNTSRVKAKSDLLGMLPEDLDKYIMAVGETGNSSYYQFNFVSKTWKEVAAWEAEYKITNQPKFLSMDEAGVFSLTDLGIIGRLSGDGDNNPLPKFIGYGITGISAYQSRLVLLSGSYVHFSAAKEYNQFSRKTVTELLDDDPIEISNANLSSAEFVYAVPFNRDLVLISRNQQAVIPANSTVLTPKTAVIYPSTEAELSLAVEPKVVERSVYYAYQRGLEYFQIGELIPNTYTDGQYYSQGMTDHIPMYAKGLCQQLTVSSTNNMVIASSGTPEVLVNQFLWSGDDRLQLAFHKWVYPSAVVYTYFSQDFLILLLDNGVGGVDVVSQNIQINMSRDKLAPYADLYKILRFEDDQAELPQHLTKYMDNLSCSTYSTVESRHYNRDLTFDGTTMTTIQSSGTDLVVGVPYESKFSITPPFIKNQNGSIVVGGDDRIRAFTPELAYSGSFEVTVGDVNGEAFGTDDSTAQRWSETDLGQAWINGIGSVTIPCRTRLSSTYCTLSTSGTYELNIRSMGYQVRPSRKHKGLYTG